MSGVRISPTALILIQELKMPRKKATRKTTTRKKKTTTKDNDFFARVVKGAKKIFSPK